MILFDGWVLVIFLLQVFFFFSYSADVCNSTENQAYGKQALNEVPGLPAWLPVMIGIADIQVHREEPVDYDYTAWMTQHVQYGFTFFFFFF